MTDSITTPDQTSPTVLDRGVDPRTKVTFATKHPNITAWLEIEYPLDAVPQGLLDDLAEVGFAQDSRCAPLPPCPGVDGHYNLTGYLVQDVHLGGPAGTDLFAGWTKDEARVHMRNARRVLRKHGLTNVPVWRKTWRDLI